MPPEVVVDLTLSSDDEPAEPARKRPHIARPAVSGGDSDDSGFCVVEDVDGKKKRAAADAAGPSGHAAAAELADDADLLIVGATGQVTQAVRFMSSAPAV